MVRCGVMPASTGNVTALEDVSFAALDISSTGSAQEAEPESSPFQEACILHDHSYLPTRNSSFIDNALTYIAGWVVRKVHGTLKCGLCRTSLVTTDIPAASDGYHLLKLKNNGGLVIPSEGVVKVVRSAESCIRNKMKLNNAAHHCAFQTVQHYVRMEIGSNDVFKLGNHIIATQYGIDNHHFQLISQVVDTFYSLRQHHIAKLHTLMLQEGSFRKKVNKSILFLGH